MEIRMKCIKCRKDYSIQSKIVEHHTKMGIKYVAKAKCPGCGGNLTRFVKKPNDMKEIISEVNIPHIELGPKIINYDPKIKVVDYKPKKKSRIFGKLFK